MTAPGYVIAAVAYAALFGLAMVIVPATAPGRWLALPGAIALAELLRWSWPFGGVPLSSLAVGQVAGPLAPVLRLGGALLLVEVTVVGRRRAGRRWSARRWLAAGVAARGRGRSPWSPPSSGPGPAPARTLRVALVQGGGPQGTRAVEHRRARGVRAPPRGERGRRDAGRPGGVARGRGRRRRRWPTSEEGERAGRRSPAGSTRTLVAGIVEDAGPDALPQRLGRLRRPTARSSTATTRSTACRSASTCRCAGCSSRFGGERADRPRRRHRRATPRVLDTPGGRAGRGHLVGDLLRRPRARGRRGRGRAGAQPDERVVVQRHPGADPAGRVVAHAGDRERPLGAPGGARPGSRRSSGRTARSTSAARCPSRWCCTTPSGCAGARRSTPAGATARRWRWRWPAWPPAGSWPVPAAGPRSQPATQSRRARRPRRASSRGSSPSNLGVFLPDAARDLSTRRPYLLRFRVEASWGGERRDELQPGGGPRHRDLRGRVPAGAGRGAVRARRGGHDHAGGRAAPGATARCSSARRPTGAAATSRRWWPARSPAGWATPTRSIIDDHTVDPVALAEALLGTIVQRAAALGRVAGATSSSPFPCA